MSLNIHQLLTGDINRLKAVPRWSTYHLVETENVAEHTCMVGLYALFITLWVNQPDNAPGISIDEATVLVRAISHDLEECRTGDQIKSFKAANGDLGRAIGAVAAAELSTVVAPLCTNSDVHSWLVGEWCAVKDQSPESCIVRFADDLAAIAFLLRQQSMGNSANAPKFTLESFQKHEEGYSGPEFDFLRPLINQALVIAKMQLLEGQPFDQGMFDRQMEWLDGDAKQPSLSELAAASTGCRHPESTGRYFRSGEETV